MQTEALRYFLSADRNVALVDTIEISHPSFTQTYHKVRNVRSGIVARIETGVDVAFDWYPLRITTDASMADLDVGIRADFGDLGQVIPQELDAINNADTWEVKPEFIYRAYRSDDYQNILVGPVRLEVQSFSFTKQGASIEAAAPYANISTTGEFYTVTRFPMLRGFLL